MDLIGGRKKRVALSTFPSHWSPSLRQPKPLSLAQMIILPFGSSRNIRGTVRSAASLSKSALTEKSSNYGDRFELVIFEISRRTEPLTMRSKVLTSSPTPHLRFTSRLLIPMVCTSFPIRKLTFFHRTGYIQISSSWLCEGPYQSCTPP